MTDAASTGRESLRSRGGAWVLAQAVLMLLAAVSPFVGPRLPAGPRRALRLPGLLLLLAGGGLFLAGVLRLGRNLTPLPKPAADAQLVQDGIYGVVRHPIYAGGVVGTLGWALLFGRWPGLAMAAAVAVFFDSKARYEERWLCERFAEYPAYRRRVRKLIPFVA